jgi:hypothetical protein
VVETAQRKSHFYTPVEKVSKIILYLTNSGNRKVILSLEKRWDTVGELGSAEVFVPHIPSWKAKKRGKLTQEKVLLEL